MENKWKIGTLRESKMAAANVKSLVFDIEGRPPHEPGQHYDIRLTSPDGYQAERSYSLASPAEESGLEFGIQILDNGEVSPYLYKLMPGDRIELRGPIGGHFVWNVRTPGPLVLAGGGSGIVPLMCMLRHYVLNEPEDSLREVIFLISARSEEYVLYRDELASIGKERPRVKIVITLTDRQPSGWKSYARRIDREMFEEVFGSIVPKMPMIYVCGPTPFVEKATSLFVSQGINPHLIKTERFGG